VPKVCAGRFVNCRDVGIEFEFGFIFWEKEGAYFGPNPSSPKHITFLFDVFGTCMCICISLRTTGMHPVDPWFRRYQCRIRSIDNILPQPRWRRWQRTTCQLPHKTLTHKGQDEAQFWLLTKEVCLDWRSPVLPSPSTLPNGNNALRAALKSAFDERGFTGYQPFYDWALKWKSLSDLAQSLAAEKKRSR
jgi:hypothetical protein